MTTINHKAGERTNGFFLGGGEEEPAGSFDLREGQFDSPMTIFMS